MKRSKWSQVKTGICVEPKYNCSVLVSFIGITFCVTYILLLLRMLTVLSCLHFSVLIVTNADKGMQCLLYVSLRRVAEIKMPPVFKTAF